MKLNAIKSNSNQLRFNYIISVSVLFLLGVLQVFILKDQVAMNESGNFRWDGTHYTDWVKNIDLIYNRGVNHYTIQRILPSMIVHYGMQLLNVKFTNLNIFYAYEIYTFIVLSLALLLYFLISDYLNFNQRQVWIGLCGLFVSFAFIKFPFIYPDITDHTALLIGMAFLYFYLRQKKWAILITGVLGSFVWQLSGITMFFLFTFPRSTQIIKSGNNLTAWIAGGIMTLLSLVYLFVSGLLTDILIFGKNVNVYPKYSPILINNRLFILSVISLLIFVFYFYYMLFRNVAIANIKTLFGRKVLFRLLIALLLWFCISVFQKHISVEGGDYTYYDFLYYTFLRALINPLVFLLSLISWFGFFIVLGIINFKKVTDVIKDFGLGFFLLTCFYCLIILDSESRTSDEFSPFILFTILLSFDFSKYSKKAIALFVISCFIFSKFWLIVSVHKALYTLNSGPWMEYRWYCIQLVIILLFAVPAWYIIRNNNKKTLPE